MPNIRRGMMGAAGVSGAETYQLFTWGSALYGTTMQGTTTAYGSPVQVGDNFMGELDLATEGILVLAERITCGDYRAAVIKADGTLWTGGYGIGGALGVGDTTNRSSPTQVGSLTDWRSVVGGNDSMCATKTDGTLWGWGEFGAHYTTPYISGQSIDVSSPVQIGTDTDWGPIFAVMTNGAACLGLKTDGSLYSWGNSTSGFWFQSTITYSVLPVAVGDKKYSYVGAGPIACLGIEKDTGKLWGWGVNSHGLQGTGDTTSRSSPIQIGSNTDWTWATGQEKTTMIYANTSGELFGSGRNDDGVLGQNIASITYSSPVQVGGPGGWAIGGHGMSDQFAAGITDANGDNTGGALWSIGGSNEGVGLNGQSAIPEEEAFSSPVQVGTDTDWICQNKQGIHRSATRIAIKRAGTAT